MTDAAIQLEPNSIYITTELIMLAGRFHWTLLVTDGAAHVEQYQWTQTGQSPGHPEAVTVNKLDAFTTMSKDCNTIIFGAFKLNEYTPPVDQQTLPMIACSVFVGHDTSSIRENRREGLTCRTWIMKVLSALKDIGCLPTTDLDAVEKTVVQRSRVLEDNYTETPDRFITSVEAV